MAVLPVGIGPVTGYNIERSLRFNSADSAYLSRTPASAGNRKTFTISFWAKRGSSWSDHYVFEAYTNDTSRSFIRFGSDKFYFAYDGSTNNLITTQVFRDVSAWYHFVLAVDTTQATNTNRLKLYVNGSQVTTFDTASYPTQNTDYFINNNIAHNVGRSGFTGGYGYFNGLLTEFNFIDGQALTQSDFGETDSATGVWKPKKYTGTYGTNGFYLNFADNSGTTSTTLGKDSSGNGNNFTPNNFSVTAGAGNDSLVDTPTAYGVDTGAGGEVRGNYATLNPLTLAGSGTGSVSDGNLRLTSPTTDSTGAQLAGTIAVSSGKYYFEGTFTTLTSSSGFLCFGIQDGLVVISGLSGSDRAGTNTWWISDDGNYRANGGSITSSGLGSFSAGDVAMIAIDASTGKGWIGKNGTWVGDPSAGTSNTFSSLPALIAPFAQAIRNTTTSSVINANFGQRPFAYTAPSGFKALCTTNLPTPTIGATSTTQANDYFNVALYTGNGSTQSITGVGFQPDFVWIKQRDAATYDHNLFDAVRGANKALFSNQTSAEITYTDRLTSFDSDGFSLGSGVGTNSNSSTRVAWNWKANGAGSSNTSGTITSTVSANTTAGFSIVTYTGTGSAGTIGHGLGVAPKMIIVKNRTAASTDSWGVYHISSNASPQNGGLYLNTTAAFTTSSAFWNNTSPTSTVFSVNTNSINNANTNTYVAYCFAEVAGYSAFGSYTGNGSTDGPFIFTNFRPRYVLIKRTDTTADWYIFDTSRNTYNALDAELDANLAIAETTAGGATFDFLSNGFKLRRTGSAVNNSGGTYVYACFAENPFKYSLAR